MYLDFGGGEVMRWRWLGDEVVEGVLVLVGLWFRVWDFGLGFSELFG